MTSRPAPPPQPPDGSRPDPVGVAGTSPRPWRLLGYSVVTVGVLSLLALSLGALFLVTVHRFLEETRNDWTQTRRGAVIHLERYWLSGEASDREAYREAFEVAERIAVPIRYALANPGDAEGLLPHLETGLADPEAVRTLYRFTRWFGEHERTRAFVKLSAAAGEVLSAIESLALEMERAGLPGALGDPGREDLLRSALASLAMLDREAEGLTAGIGEGIRAWSADVQNFIQRALWVAGFVVLLAGMLVLRGAARRVSRSEEAVRESQVMLSQVTGAIREVFWLTPPDKSRILYVSPAFAEIWGRPVDDLYERADIWLDAIHPDDRARVQAALPLQETGGYDIEYRIETPDGRRRWIHDKAFPVRGSSGEVLRVAGVAEDITHRKEMEEEMLRTRNLRSVGRLAGGVAHQFNNLLTAIVGRVQLLRMDRPEDGELQEELEAVEEGVERARNLTRGLLAYAREQTLLPRAVDLPELVEGSSDMIRSILPEEVELELDLAGVPAARVDPSFLKETLLNLSALARDTMPSRGRITLRTTSVRANGPIPVEGGELAPGRWIALEFEHSDYLLPAETRKLLLEPFGTGLGGPDGDLGGMGLASLHGFVEQSGGGMAVEVAADGGTVLRIFLPESRLERPSSAA